MATIYRYTLIEDGVDFRSGDGLNLCHRVLRQWLEIPDDVKTIELLISREEFEESICLTPRDDLVTADTWWYAHPLSGRREVVCVYYRTTERFLEISKKQIYLGVEY